MNKVFSILFSNGEHTISATRSCKSTFYSSMNRKTSFTVFFLLLLNHCLGCGYIFMWTVSLKQKFISFSLPVMKSFLDISRDARPRASGAALCCEGILKQRERANLNSTLILVCHSFLSHTVCLSLPPLCLLL